MKVKIKLVVAYFIVGMIVGSLISLLRENFIISVLITAFIFLLAGILLSRWAV